MSNLTTLAAVKMYLSITTSNQDALINALIARESDLAEKWTGRVFTPLTFVDKRMNGNGSKMLGLPSDPIINVTALSIFESAIPQSTDGLQSGYMFDDLNLYLIGYVFSRGQQNVKCSWNSGYHETESGYVPTGNTPTLTPVTGGTAYSPISVVDNTMNMTLAQVGSNPGAGQYAFSAGSFIFSSTHYNHAITMNYYYIPSPVEQAVIEMVGLDLQQRNNIGINSKSLATETVTYEKKGITDSAKEMLYPYRKMVIA